MLYHILTTAKNAAYSIFYQQKKTKITDENGNSARTKGEISPIQIISEANCHWHTHRLPI